MVSENEENFEEEKDEPTTVEPSKRKVIAEPSDPSIGSLYDSYKGGFLDPQPKFQRDYIWDRSKASCLIESVFMKVPIPIIYTAEEADGKESVIDGQQRLTTFFSFIDGRDSDGKDFKLSKLEVFTELSGKSFRDLEPEQQNFFKRYPVRIVKIREEADPDIKFEIFKRLNTGAVTLNDQELRNCIYRGNYNELLKELVQNRDFLFLFGTKKPDKRMRNIELILRFFGFYNQAYLRYKPSMKQFLNREMENNKEIAERKENELRNVFKKSVELTKTVFGERAFRRFIPGTKKDKNGKWEVKKINKSLFDVVMYGFTQYDKHQIVPYADSIREELIYLMANDKEFIDSVIISTSAQSKVLTRFDKWRESLRNVVGFPKTEPRCFSTELKKELFERNNTCQICRQEIQTLDDAEVDHIEFYWRGGKTIPENARLVHRYCNRARGGRGEV